MVSLRFSVQEKSHNVDALAKKGYANDIRPLFRDHDIKAMIKARNLDLSSFDQVSASADEILKRLEAGDMPTDHRTHTVASPRYHGVSHLEAG